jgi:hypothetical protein
VAGVGTPAEPAPFPTTKVARVRWRLSILTFEPNVKSDPPSGDRPYTPAHSRVPGGGGGIRTHGALLLTRFRDARIRPGYATPPATNHYSTDAPLSKPVAGWLSPFSRRPSGGTGQRPAGGALQKVGDAPQHTPQPGPAGARSDHTRGRSGCGPRPVPAAHPTAAAAPAGYRPARGAEPLAPAIRKVVDQGDVAKVVLPAPEGAVCLQGVPGDWVQRRPAGRPAAGAGGARRTRTASRWPAGHPGRARSPRGRGRGQSCRGIGQRLGRCDARLGSSWPACDHLVGVDIYAVHILAEAAKGAHIHAQTAAHVQDVRPSSGA